MPVHGNVEIIGFMRRFLLTTVISIIVLMVCMGAWVFGQEHRRQITVVGDVAYPPFEYRDEYGKVCGISVDLWKLWGQKTGVEVRYLLYDWNDAIELVRRGEADAVGGIFLRDDPSLSFSNPYLRLNVRIISSDGISQINTTEDMKGFQVGVVRGDFMEKYLQKMAPDVPLVLAPNFESLVKMAIDGQVKVFVCDEPVAKFLLAKHGTLEQFAFSNDPLRVDLLRAGVNVKDQALLKLVNEGFSRITHEEKMEVLLRWTGHRVVPPSRWKLLAGVFLFCLAILAGVMVWNWQLRRNVAKATTVLTNKQDEFEAIFQAMPDMFFLVDEKGRYLEFRGGAQSRPLVPPELFLGKTISQVMPHEAAERLQVALELAGQRREVVNLEYELEEVDQRRNYDARIAPLGDSQFVCLVRDITEQKNCEQEQAMAAQVIENAIEGIIVADENGIVLMANPACKAITGYQTEELIGGQLDILRSENDSLDLYAKVWAALTENGQWSGEYWNRRKNGEAYPEWLTLTLIRDSQDRIAYYLAIFYDITEIKQSQEQLKYQAYHDALTGLPNRILLQDRLGHAIQHTRREGGRVGVLFIDLDNFKSVNDSLGHDMGDIVLKQVTARLRDCLREQDTVARVGGDEFVMVLEAVESESGAVRVGRRVLERLSSEFDLPGHVIKISASIGIALYPDDGRSVDTLIKNADLAMYRAKEKGKNNYQLFTPALQDSAQRRMVLEGALRQALEDRQFEVHYQPWFNLAVDRILGVEALLRWIHPERGCLNPGEFIGLAEETGLIVPIGEWVLAEACGQAKSWIASNPDLKISINLSVMQLLQENLASAVKQALSDTGLPPGNLELEIIENAVIRNEQKAAESLQALSALGVRLTFDDYGAGNSSLSCLKHLPIDLIKIDRSFTDRIAAQENDAAIVKSIIELGRNLRITIVAKGVETPEQLAVLREIGCEGVQGFLLGRPVPASELEKLLI